MFNFVNQGVLVSIVQVLFLALWFAQPTTLNWIPFYFSSGKIYLTTLLSRGLILIKSIVTHRQLSMRGHTQNKHSSMYSLDGPSFTPMNRGFGQHTNGAMLTEAPGVHIARTVEIFNDTDSFPSNACKPDDRFRQQMVFMRG
ncbi:hypothetical protein K439DRAFT_1642420 [Ramaria rubella]|nr:hypothetical protein K439DRAFT_1642420 [Ramaria rubella]